MPLKLTFCLSSILFIYVLITNPCMQQNNVEVKNDSMSRHIALWADTYCFTDPKQKEKQCMSRHKARMSQHMQCMSRHIPLCIGSYWVDLEIQGQWKLYVDECELVSTHNSSKCMFSFFLHYFYVSFMVIRYGCNI